MKKLMIGLALTAMATTSAFAQYSTGTHVRAPHSTMSMYGPGHDAYAYAPERGYGAANAWSNPGAVIVDGEYRGADPDPAVRHQLRRNDHKNQ